MIKIITGCVSLMVLTSTAVAADKTAFPAGCDSGKVQYSQTGVWLQTHDQQSLFLLANKSNQTLLINRVVKNPGMSAGFTSQIDAGKWSALSLGQKTHVTCAIQSHDRIRYVACKDVLKVCQYATPSFPDTLSQGTYWVAENSDYTQINQQITKRGIRAVS